MASRFVKIFACGALWGICGLFVIFSPVHAVTSPPSIVAPRYFFTGDGVLRLMKNGGALQSVSYRSADGVYIDAGLTTLSRIWGIAPQAFETIDRRLLEVLDHVQEHFHNAPIVLLSGFRSRTYNDSLRKQGRLAAQSSMHIEAAAADLFLQGVRSADVAAYVQGLQCCGVGNYGGRTIHIDTGNVRWWDAATSGTESQEPQRNARILASTEYDRYHAGETVAVRVLRITELPIVVATTATLECQRDGEWKRVETASMQFLGGYATGAQCLRLPDLHTARLGAWSHASSRGGCGRYRLEIRFCERSSELMPEKIYTNYFEIIP